MNKITPNFTSRYILHGEDVERKQAFNKIKMALFANNVYYSYFYPLDIYDKKPINQVMICTNDKNGDDADKCIDAASVMYKFAEMKNQIINEVTKILKDHPEKLKESLAAFKPEIPKEVTNFLEESPRFDIDLKPEHEASNVIKGLSDESFNPITGEFGEKGEYKSAIHSLDI